MRYYRENSRGALLFSYKKEKCSNRILKFMYLYAILLKLNYLWTTVESNLGAYTHWVKYQALTYLNISPFLSHHSWFCLNLIHVWCNICTCTALSKQSNILFIQMMSVVISCYWLIRIIYIKVRMLIYYDYIYSFVCQTDLDVFWVAKELI